MTAIDDKPHAGRYTPTGARTLQGTAFALFVHAATPEQIDRCPDNPFAFGRYLGAKPLYADPVNFRGPTEGAHALELARAELGDAEIVSIYLSGRDVVALIQSETT